MTSSQHITQVRDLFDSTAQSWHDRYVNFSCANDLVLWERKQITADHVRSTIPYGSTILDAGCGAGNLAIELAHDGYSVHGIDIAPSMIQLCEEKVSKQHPAGLSCTFATATLQELHATGEGQYDCIIGLGLIEYQDDATMGIPDLAALLKPGGTLILSGPQIFSLSKAFGLPHFVLNLLRTTLRRLGLPNFRPVASIDKYTLRSLTKLAQQVGFRREHFWQHGYASFLLIGPLLGFRGEKKINDLLSDAQRFGHFGFLANDLIVSFRKLH